MAQSGNYKLLTEGPVRKVLLMMAGPTIISMLVTSIYNIVTTFYAGRLNNQATAAVGIAFSIMSVIQAFAYMFGQGSGNYISRELGARRTMNAEHMASAGFVSAVGIGMVICIAGLIFLRPLSILLGSTPTILPYTMIYMKYVLLGAPFMAGALCLNCQMRFQGNTAYAMYGLTAGAVLNIVLAPVLMFALGMGIRGAGISTLAGQICSFVILLYMSGRDKNVHIHIREGALTKDLFMEILAGGTPSLTRQGFASVSVAMLNVAASAYGDEAVAAMSIVGRITFVIFAVVIGLGQGYQPLCGFCYGAGLYRRVRQGYWTVLRIGTYFMAVCTVLGFCFPGQMISAFRHDPEVVRIGSEALKWQLATLCTGPLITYTNMMMQTTRKPWRANILASARSGLFFIPLIIILPRHFGLLGVEMCQTWADALSFLLAVVIAISGFHELMRLEKKNNTIKSL